MALRSTRVEPSSQGITSIHPLSTAAGYPWRRLAGGALEVEFQRFLEVGHCFFLGIAFAGEVHVHAPGDVSAVFLPGFITQGFQHGPFLQSIGVCLTLYLFS